MLIRQKTSLCAHIEDLQLGDFKQRNSHLARESPALSPHHEQGEGYSHCRTIVVHSIVVHSKAPVLPSHGGLLFNCVSQKGAGHSMYCWNNGREFFALSLDIPGRCGCPCQVSVANACHADDGFYSTSIGQWVQCRRSRRPLCVNVLQTFNCRLHNSALTRASPELSLLHDKAKGIPTVVL